MIIPVTPDIEKALAEEAHRLGTTPERLALDSLRERFVLAGPVPPAEAEGRLADFLGGYIGLLHSSEHIPGGGRLSEDCGKKFAASLLAQREKGRQ